MGYVNRNVYKSIGMDMNRSLWMDYYSKISHITDLENQANSLNISNCVPVIATHIFMRSAFIFINEVRYFEMNK